jgi:hypothetical protein
MQLKVAGACINDAIDMAYQQCRKLNVQEFACRVRSNKVILFLHPLSRTPVLERVDLGSDGIRWVIQK